MSPNEERSDKTRATSALNLTLAAVVSQVGCLTSVIVLAALFGGLWLDSRFSTKPVITVGLIVISVPITLFSMIWVVKKATSRINTDGEQNPQPSMKEELISE
jgi:ABC-type transport system involved in cytochrome c biogenesis permease subunit